MPWPDHLLSLDEWDALPEDNSRRYEVAEGVLEVSPRPAPKHQRAEKILVSQLDSQLPGDREALAEVEITISVDPLLVRVPDIVVVPKVIADSEAVRCAPSDVELAVEIISPGSGRKDRITKFAEYADAGIKRYWIVDLDKPVTISAYVLVDGEYEVVGEASDYLVVDEPAPMTIDIPALLP